MSSWSRHNVGFNILALFDILVKICKIFDFPTMWLTSPVDIREIVDNYFVTVWAEFTTQENFEHFGGIYSPAVYLPLSAGVAKFETF